MNNPDKGRADRGVVAEDFIFVRGRAGRGVVEEAYTYSGTDR